MMLNSLECEKNIRHKGVSGKFFELLKGTGGSAVTKWHQLPLMTIPLLPLRRKQVCSTDMDFKLCWN